MAFNLGPPDSHRSSMGTRKKRRMTEPFFMAQPRQSTLPPELEAYFSDPAIAEQMKGEKQDAKAQMLLAAGAAMLGAPDLMSSMGAAMTAGAEPYFAQRQREREMPQQLAMQRYGIGLSEEERERSRNDQGMEESLFNLNAENIEYGKTLRALNERILGYEADKGEIDVGTGRFTLGTLPELFRQQTEKHGADLTEAQERINDARSFRGPRVRSLETGSYLNEAGAWNQLLGDGGSGGYGDLGMTLSRLFTEAGESDAAKRQLEQGGRLPDDPIIQQGYRLAQQFGTMPETLEPGMVAEIMPGAYVVNEIMKDVSAGMPDDQLVAKYQNDPHGWPFLKYLLWDKESEVPQKMR